MSSTAPAPDKIAAGERGPAGGNRLAGLDGIRGLSALYVVLHHCWLMSFPGFPADTGPVWTGWLLHGHFAVVVFIVLSGFSLGIAPARSDWQLGGIHRFYRRRAWRILPPYWAALIFSLIIAWVLIPQPGTGRPTGKSALIHGLLLQDVFGSPTPNGTFWSIAIEAQLYLVFPLMLVIRRRIGVTALLGLMTGIVVAIELLSGWVPVIAMLKRFTPQLAALFAVGVVAAGAITGHGRRLPWSWLALAAAVPVLVLIPWQGSEWTVAHYFWVDLTLGPAVCLLLIAVSHGSPALLVRLLNTRALRRLGLSSYSLYLTHAPIVVALYHFAIAPYVTHGVPAFLSTLAVAVPVSLAVAHVFALAFELPFQRHRSFRTLTAAGFRRLSRTRAAARD